jgi:hypothetical protein
MTHEHGLLLPATASSGAQSGRAVRSAGGMEAVLCRDPCSWRAQRTMKIPLDFPTQDRAMPDGSRHMPRVCEEGGSIDGDMPMC